MVILPPKKKKPRKINLHEHFSLSLSLLGCHRQSNTFPACTRRLAQEKSQETGLEGTKGKVEREMSGVGRDMGRCVKQISSSLCRGRGAAFIPSAMATTFPWNNARLDFAALPIHADRIGGYLLHEHFSARWSHLISRNFGSNEENRGSIG